VERVDGLYCNCCGALVAVPRDSKHRTTIVQGQGRQDAYVLSVDGHEVHRCAVEREVGVVKPDRHGSRA
jgi:hypothetical protein